MKRIIAVFLATLLLTSVAIAEETDYSWLDDLTINQLKELDAEIHKRIPGQAASEEPSQISKYEDIIIGDWKTEYTDANPGSHKGHKHTVAYIFNKGQTGKIEQYCLTKKQMVANGESTYEFYDEETLNIVMHYMGGTYPSSVTFYEDETGVHFKDSSDRVFSKVK